MSLTVIGVIRSPTVPEEHLMYFLDITEQMELEKLYEEEKTVIAIIYLDNYDELTQGMDDQARSNINSLVISILNDWAQKNGIYMKRFSSDRFVAVFNERILQTLEKNKFAILDDVREITAKTESSSYIEHRRRVGSHRPAGTWRACPVEPRFGSRPGRGSGRHQTCERKSEVLRRQNQSR